MVRVKLLGQLRRVIRARHYSRRTEQAYVWWVRRFVRFHAMRHPADLDEKDVSAFLTHLAVNDRVSAATQNQAASALLFLYEHVVGRRLRIEGVVRAKEPERIPVVLTRAEVRRVLDEMAGVNRLIVQLLWGSGLRLLEALQLRVKDLDLERREIRVRGGKGGRARVTMIAEMLIGPLRAHLERVRRSHDKDRAAGGGGAPLPGAFHRKVPGAVYDWP